MLPKRKARAAQRGGGGATGAKLLGAQNTIKGCKITVFYCFGEGGEVTQKANFAQGPQKGQGGTAKSKIQCVSLLVCMEL